MYPGRCAQGSSNLNFRVQLNPSWRYFESFLASFYAANDECLFRKTFSATASAALTEYKIRLEGLRGFSSELMFYIVKTSLKDARTQFGSQNATTDSMGN